MMDRTINIRDIQHYMYCPRRFALLAINDDWVENAFVVKANLMHEKVHSGQHDFSSKNKVVKSSVTIYNDESEFDMFGIADCIEFERSRHGTYVPELNDYFLIKVIEYKPKPPKEGDFHESDAIQVFAQKKCVDYIWKGDCECYIYYSSIKRRVKLPFDTQRDQYNEMLINYLKRMREILETETIPAIRKGQKCSGCSIEGVCFPKSIDYNVKGIIMSMDGKED